MAGAGAGSEAGRPVGLAAARWADGDLVRVAARLNAPAQIDAARELAKAKGGDVPRISRLSAGEFYLATKGRGFQQVRTPMCLSHHSSSPLTEDEVLTRAARRIEEK